MIVVWRIVPDVHESKPNERSGALKDFLGVLSDPQLGGLNIGVFSLHAVLMAIFIAIPFSLRDAGLPLAEHWKIYLPVMLGSFVLMMPAVVGRGRSHLKAYFTASVALLVVAHVVLPWLKGSVALLTVFLVLFFTPFNILEALLPTLTSKMAPARNKGVAIGLYSSVQFFGTFMGAVLGGFAYGHWGLTGVVIVNTVLLVTWLAAAIGMKLPVASSTRTYTLPRLDETRAEALVERVVTLEGVRRVRWIRDEHTLALEVDSGTFDEQNVLQLITRET
jgi:predicted MFS family arabinose efflux permease